MLKQLIEEKWLKANAVVGFWPANSVGDDIELYTDESRTKVLATLHTLRQQMARDGNKANLALADFIAPKESGLADYLGGFAVTAGIGEEDVAREFERANDDYSKIMVKALADRLAEAFAEALHAKVRRELWGYAPDEKLSNEATDRRGLCRHPSRARLSRAARPHREAHSVRAPRCRDGDWLEAHRSPAPCGRRLLSQDFISPILRAAISASVRSAATRCRITPPAKAGRSTRPNAGSGRS